MLHCGEPLFQLKSGSTLARFWTKVVSDLNETRNRNVTGPLYHHVTIWAQVIYGHGQVRRDKRSKRIAILNFSRKLMPQPAIFYQICMLTVVKCTVCNQQTFWDPVLLMLPVMFLGDFLLDVHLSAVICNMVYCVAGLHLAKSKLVINNLKLIFSCTVQNAYNYELPRHIFLENSLYQNLLCFNTAKHHTGNYYAN